jgi:CheY-like chemotaxis protein
MGGAETMLKLLEQDPSAVGIVASGYADDPILANYREHGFSGVVAKPFKIRDLVSALESVLI